MKWFFRILLWILIFSLGWMFGLFVEHWDVFHLSFDVSAFNIINLLVVSLLGWMVSYFVQNSSRKVKSKIDLVSNKIDEIDSNIKRLSDLVGHNSGASYVEVCSIDKRIRRWSTKISETIKSNYPTTCDKDTLKTLSSNLYELRTLTTNIPRVISGQIPEAIVLNDIVKYSNERRTVIEVKIDEIRFSLYQIKINISQS
ncbi:MAG: hypothetical protein MJZ24_01195 [Paludibacteraceae bacterium]|nr:hypothetical protein [Paludibacteraceae bacterium]